jgi:hypothetical protein
MHGTTLAYKPIRKMMKRFVNAGLNRICLKVVLWGIALLVLLYILNNFIRPFLASSSVQGTIYSISLILFYAAFCVTILSLLLMLLNVIRKRLFQ